MNSENSKASDPHRLLLNLSDKKSLKISDKICVALTNLSIYYTWGNIKKSYKIIKFKISAPTWNKEFELTYGPYSPSDIQDCFEDIIKRHETVRAAFKIKTVYYLERLTPQTMKLLGSTKSKKTKGKTVKMYLI